MHPEQQPGMPTRLSTQSRAAAAQRVDERPLPTPHGLFYDIPHHSLHPRGWHLRLHLKRKHLRRTNQHYTATDRVGTRWSLLPLTFVLLALMVSAGSLVIGATALTIPGQPSRQGRHPPLARTPTKTNPTPSQRRVSRVT